MVQVRRYWTNFSPFPKNANFPTPSRWGCPPSRKFLREIRKNSHNLKIGFVYRKNALKRIRTCDLYLRLEMNHTAWTRTPALQLRLTSLIEIKLMHPIITQETPPFFKRSLSECAQFPGRYQGNYGKSRLSSVIIQKQNVRKITDTTRTRSQQFNISYFGELLRCSKTVCINGSSLRSQAE